MNSAIILLLLFSLAMPLPLLVVEKILPYPFIIEELVKLTLVLLTVNQVKKKGSLLPLIIIEGILFSISESMFYLLNIIQIGNTDLFWERIIIVGLMHTFTMIIMYFFVKKGSRWTVVGFLVAMLIHLAYNTMAQ